MTETKPDKNVRGTNSLKRLIRPPIEEMLIDRFFRGDAESYFRKHAHEHIQEVYAALTPDLTILVETAKRLAGRSAKTPTPNLFTSARNGKLGLY